MGGVIMGGLVNDDCRNEQLSFGQKIVLVERVDSVIFVAVVASGFALARFLSFLIPCTIEIEIGGYIRAAFLFVASLYMVLRDWMQFRRFSFRYYLGLEAVVEDSGQECSLKDSIIRNGKFLMILCPSFLYLFRWLPNAFLGFLALVVFLVTLQLPFWWIIDLIHWLFGKSSVGEYFSGAVLRDVVTGEQQIIEPFLVTWDRAIKVGLAFMIVCAIIGAFTPFGHNHSWSPKERCAHNVSFLESAIHLYSKQEGWYFHGGNENADSFFDSPFGVLSRRDLCERTIVLGEVMMRVEPALLEGKYIQNAEYFHCPMEEERREEFVSSGGRLRDYCQQSYWFDSQGNVHCRCHSVFQLVPKMPDEYKVQKGWMEQNLGDYRK